MACLAHVLYFAYYASDLANEDTGRIFGKGGSGFQRINTACLRSILTEALERIAEAIK